jgi:uncharacterized protein YndB with AHSA1/START domain
MSLQQIWNRKINPRKGASKMNYQVNAEKVIGRPVSDVFNALKEGLLFMNCGADSGSIQIDFRVGGKYQIDFRNKTLVNFGEFLEIIPNRKIVFSWCQTFGPDQKPDTQVVIELFEDGSKTRLLLSHTGFKDQATKDAHQTGWFGGLEDFIGQIENGKLRMLRNFPVSKQRLQEVCKTPESLMDFAGYKGPLNLSNIILNVIPKDDGSSTLEIIHQGLNGLEEQKSHRAGWETVTKKMTEVL